MKTNEKISTFGMIGKLAFVGLCCSLAAYAAASLHAMYGGKSLAIGMLAAVVIVAFKLGMQGKESESWAILAYGSWMTMPCMLLFAMIGRDHSCWTSCNRR